MTHVEVEILKKTGVVTSFSPSDEVDEERGIRCFRLTFHHPEVDEDKALEIRELFEEIIKRDYHVCDTWGNATIAIADDKWLIAVASEN